MSFLHCLTIVFGKDGHPHLLMRPNKRVYGMLQYNPRISVEHTSTEPGLEWRSAVMEYHGVRGHEMSLHSKFAADLKALRVPAGKLVQINFTELGDWSLSHTPDHILGVFDILCQYWFSRLGRHLTLEIRLNQMGRITYAGLCRPNWNTFLRDTLDHPFHNRDLKVFINVDLTREVCRVLPRTGWTWKHAQPIYVHFRSRLGGQVEICMEPMDPLQDLSARDALATIMAKRREITTLLDGKFSVVDERNN